MPFPDSPRVIYQKNPLAEVICQISFPAILKIDSELPAKYQEFLRDEYPIFAEAQSSNVKLNLVPEVAQLMGLPPSLRGGKSIYEFISQDSLWKVTLTRESFAIQTRAYEKWEDFKAHLNIPLKALRQVYAPTFITRIGLRYQDIIKRSELELEGAEWGDLLKPQIAAELSSPDIANEIIGCMNQIKLSLGDDGSFITLNHGLETTDKSGDEVCYLIDSDFFTEQKTEVQNVIQKLDEFNRHSGRLFRWCIADKLHNALLPVPAAPS